MFGYIRTTTHTRVWLSVQLKGLKKKFTKFSTNLMVFCLKFIAANKWIMKKNLISY
jgi:hypothetical protein